jgi:hypothetical protein
MATNDFQPFAIGAGENVIAQAAYLAAAWRETGFLAGLAQSDQLNKVWRQSAFVGASLAQFIADTLGADVLDNGDQAAFIVQLSQALAIAAISRPSRIVTSSAALAVLITDYAVGFNRTAGLAATAVALPAAGVGQEFVFEDLVGNFSTYPVTLNPPVGQTIAGLATFVLNEDRQSASVRYYGSNLWSIRS